ncbi:MAG TPA: hypothetical protein VMY37_19565 [Thermoguttaceae bacterium]|nr:hypothetical protein [Thermoguttaceae bacterium]
MIASQQLAELFEASLGERIFPGRPAVVTLLGEPMLFRLMTASGVESHEVTLDGLANHELPWRSVGRVSRLLGRVSDGGALSGSVHGWGKVLLPFLTAMAGGLATRLTEQMGRRSALPFRQDRLQSRFRTQYDACLRDAEQARSLGAQITNHLIDNLKRPPFGHGLADPPGMIRLESIEGRIRVTWLSANGWELCRETLQELADRACSSSCVLGLLDAARRVNSRQEEYWAAGRAQLQAASVPLAEAVDYALRTDRCVGLWIASTRVRGLPAEAYLYIDPTMPGLRYGRVSLVARRAHEEFVLGNAEGQLFYFPPIQLVAGIDFTGASPPWSVPRPYVRMPRHNPAWRHPYTGTLKPDRFAEAEMLTVAERDAMAPISKEARAMLPSLARDAFPIHGGTSDLCLSTQDFRIGRLVEATCGSRRDRPEMDLLGLVLGLWDMVRIGLIRAHEVNSHMPRISLARGSMCHELPGFILPRGAKLANRVFPYSPRAAG